VRDIMQEEINITHGNAYSEQVIFIELLHLNWRRTKVINSTPALTIQTGV
jgi:hypothetical protein